MQFSFHPPDSLKLSDVDELRDILSYSIGDVLTSITTTVPYKVDELQHMLGVVDEIQKNIKSSACVSVYSRFMYIFGKLDSMALWIMVPLTHSLLLPIALQRFYNFHGQPAARLDRDRSVHYDPSHKAPRTWLLSVLSPLLFFAPDTYRRALDKLWVDGMLHAASWNEFIGDMSNEWQQLILLGTVVLNANVAFLAIQSVDEDAADLDRSPAQIASYLSVMASIGSIIIGLALTRKNKANSKEAVEGSAIFLSSFAKHKRGLDPLAILYSVPYAFLMWGIVLFLVAFSIMCLQHSTITIKLLLGGAWVITALPIIWCAYTLATLDKWVGTANEFILGNVARYLSECGRQSLIALGLKSEATNEQEFTVEAPRRRATQMSEVFRRASNMARIIGRLGRVGRSENKKESAEASGAAQQDGNGVAHVPV
ncbi:hypothetical protein VNI00_018595 [Paramarasmius palmivorus]|uniref:Uncharacterized protein n=1 Tax=Paramarasmius palmivorus TaxID=297713 RepID=A0AAW0AX01_9AGAR